MYVSPKLQDAIEKTRKKFPGVYFENNLTCKFIGGVSDFLKNSNNRLKKQGVFRKALLDALKYSNIWEDRTRAAYKSLAGAYFGPQGGRKSGQVRRSKKKSREDMANKMLEDAKAHEVFHKNRLQDDY